MVVAIAAPSTPNGEMGPSPKISIGSRTMLIPLASHRVLMANEASPAPLNMAFIRNNKRIVIFPPNMICV